MDCWMVLHNPPLTAISPLSVYMCVYVQYGHTDKVCAMHIIWLMNDLIALNQAELQQNTEL